MADSGLTKSQIRACQEDWARLQRAERRRVLRLARQGRPHPDPRIARIARGWALSVAPPGGDDETVAVGVAGVVVGILMDLLSAVLGLGAGGEGLAGGVSAAVAERRKRRYARLILRLGADGG